MKTAIRHAQVEFISQKLLRPMQISKGLITEVTEARATVQVRVDGREGMGRGSIFLSDLWAWPEPVLTHDQRDQKLRRLCLHMAKALPEAGGKPAHPLEVGLRLHDRLAHHLPAGFEDVPLLASAMCLSPFDAAIHDATGQALNRSAFDFYRQPDEIPAADHMFPGQGAIAAIRELFQSPRMELPAWLCVGKNDDLQADVAPAIRKRNYRHFKLKVLGRDNAEDVARCIETYRKARVCGVGSPRLSIDSNEANPDAASVLDFLRQLQAADVGTFDAVMYLEQPTGRDILRHAYDWREVSKLKPVLLDEGLTRFVVLPEAKAQGWSGLALKTCKGHSFALVAGAWARQNRMVLSLQDLTNPGFSAIHAALFAAFVPTINGIELNSPQYAPSANVPWLPRLGMMLDPANGVHRLPEKIPAGLGSTL
jgi:L-alanine-DL-glutamate epimerase-like enolase superfamily enzyme